MQTFTARKRSATGAISYKDVAANNRKEAALLAKVPEKDVWLNTRKH